MMKVFLQCFVIHVVGSTNVRLVQKSANHHRVDRDYPILEATGRIREIRPLKSSNMIKPFSATLRLLYFLSDSDDQSWRKSILFKSFQVLSEKRRSETEPEGC